MPKIFYIQIDLLGHPDNWHFEALHELMRAEGFRRKERQLTGCRSLSDASYFGRWENSEGALRSSLRDRIAEAVWGHAHVRVSPLQA